MVHHLQRLGFESVYNRNEDFYAAIEDGRTPEHDVVVTNPPYSGDHAARLLRWCGGGGGGGGDGDSAERRPVLALM
eukprot:COSAG04_NODE_7_length_45988_cov_220.188869_18_plen_76_part_00